MSSGQTSSLLSPALMRKGHLPQRATPFSCLHNQETLETSELPLPWVLHFFLLLWPRVLERLLQNKMSEILSRAEWLQCWETPEDLYRRWMSDIWRNTHRCSAQLRTDPPESKPPLHISPSANQASEKVSLGFKLSNSSSVGRWEKRGQITAKKSIQSNTWLSDIW